MLNQSLISIGSLAGLLMFPVLGETAQICRSARDRNVSSIIFISAKVRHSNGLEEDFTGTGFIVDPEGYVLTCSHVVPKGAGGVMVRVEGSVGVRHGHIYPLTEVARDEDADLVLLKLPPALEPWRAIRRHYNAEAKLYSPICALGFPLEQDLVGVEGTMTGRDEKGRWLTDAALNRGTSGGPVFDRKGVLVGIVAAGYEAGRPLNVVIPVRWARKILGDDGEPLSRPLGMVVGYRTMETRGVDVRHDTHPDDTLLPGSGVPGSAGTTSIREGDWLFLGVRLRKGLQKSQFSTDLVALVAPGDNEARRQNENDFRPADEGSFIYSTANWGAAGAVRYTYSLGRVRVGGEAQLSVVYVESGWERFGRREEADQNFKHLGSIGPMVGVRLGRDQWLESTYQFGDARGLRILFATFF